MQISDDDALSPLRQYQRRRLEEAIETSVELTAAPERKSGSRRSLLWFSLALLLVLGMAVQYISYEFDGLLQHQRFRTLVLQSCNRLGNWFDCPASVMGQPGSQWRSDELVVRSHPEFADALIATFIFRNTSNQAGAFPQVELRFLDRRQQLVASRIFTPEEYLPAGLQHFSRLPADTPVQAELALADPGADAVNYQLRFLPR